MGTGWVQGSEMFERPPRPNLTDFFLQFFFQKAHFNVISYPFPTFFGRIHKICLLPQIGHFFRGTDTFQELRAQAVRGARALLYQLLESARWQFCSKQSISWVSRTILWYYGRSFPRIHLAALQCNTGGLKLHLSTILVFPR